MKPLLLIAFAICSIIMAQGQFSDTTPHHIATSASGILNRTNDGRSHLINNAIRYGMRRKSIALNAAATYIYGEQQKNTTNNDFSSTLDFNLYKTIPHFYYWGLAAYDKSLSLKINHRFQTGLGVAYSFIDTETAFINLSDGFIYENGDLKLTDTTNDRYGTVRNSLRLRYRFVFANTVTLDGGHFWQPSLTAGNDYIVKSNSSLAIKIYRHLSFTKTLAFNKVKRTARENLLLTFGVAYEQYFR